MSFPEQKIKGVTHKVIYACVSLFILVSATSQIYLISNVTVFFSKLVQLISLPLPIALTCYGLIVRPRLSKLSVYSLMPLAFVCSCLVVSVLFPGNYTSFKLIFISFLQMFFSYFWIFFATRVSYSLLNRIVRVSATICLIGLCFSLLEFFMPVGFRVVALKLIFHGGIPDSYFSRDVSLFSGGLRLGSIYGSPLTFAYSCIFLLTYYVCRGGRLSVYITAIMAVLTQVKTAMVGQAIVIMSRWIRLYYKLVYLSVALMALSVALLFNPYDLLDIKQSSSFKSTSNHLVGLSSGIRAAFDNPLIGKGLGQSGYVVYLESKNLAINPFLDKSEFLNGNESVIGVVAYQMGLIALFLHFLLYYKILVRIVSVNNFKAMGFLFFILLFQVFSESPLTMFITITSSLLLIWMTYASKHN